MVRLCDGDSRGIAISAEQSGDAAGGGGPSGLDHGVAHGCRTTQHHDTARVQAPQFRQRGGRDLVAQHHEHGSVAPRQRPSG